MEKKRSIRRKKRTMAPKETGFFWRGVCCVVLAAALLAGRGTGQGWVESVWQKLGQQVSFGEVKEAVLEAKETVAAFLDQKTTALSPKTEENEN